jgi:beta-glucanase (GH16 family)
LSTFDSGLFILSVDHIPAGPPAAGLWPAFWTYGPDWPNQGEIDILESITYYDHNDISLHTNEGCSFSVNDSIFFNGQWAQQSYGPMTNCTTNPGYGCSITAPNGTYNTGFNQAGGGVYAMEWDSQNFIRIWNFVKPNVPADILNVGYYSR